MPKSPVERTQRGPLANRRALGPGPDANLVLAACGRRGRRLHQRPLLGQLGRRLRQGNRHLERLVVGLMRTPDRWQSGRNHGRSHLRVELVRQVVAVDGNAVTKPTPWSMSTALFSVWVHQASS